MKIFFITGFTTIGDDDYINFDYIKDDITFFYYTRAEKMDSIERRLLKEFNEYHFDWIIANSMGGFFASRLLARCLEKQNVLFICPYIETNFVTKLTCAIPLPYIPNWFILTNLAVRIKFKYVDFLIVYLIETQLLKSVNKNINTKAYLETYKKHNVHVIYGSEDNVAKMTPMTIANLMTTCKVYCIHSRHEPFNDDYVIKNNLKRRILSILSSLENK